MASAGSKWFPLISSKHHIWCTQGSVLGPVLFLLYINDITDTIHSNIQLFADDSIVYREIRSPADHDILQTDIKKLTDWSNKWQMKFNTSKCHLLTITHKSKPSQFTYTISNQPISRVNSHESRTIPHSDNSPLDNSPLDNSPLDNNPLGQFPTP